MANIILQAGGGSGGTSPWKKVLKDSTFSLSQEELVGVTKIRPYAFNSSKIQSIDMPEGVTEIGEYAFEQCYQINSMSVPSSVQRVGTNAFGYDGDSIPGTYYNNTKFLGNNDNPYVVLLKVGNVSDTSLPYAIQDGTKIIYARAFSSFSNYSSTTQSISIPDSVSQIGNRAFYRWTGLSSLSLPFTSNLKYIDDEAFTNCGISGTIVFPGSLISIGTNAFGNCSSLQEISFFSRVELGNQAFSNCSSLTSVHGNVFLPAIPQGCFQFCTSLSTIDATLTSMAGTIGNYAFFNTAITAITLDASVSIGDYAFQNCSSLIDIYYGGTMSDWSNVNKGTGWDNGTGNYTVHCSDGDIPK